MRPFLTCGALLLTLLLPAGCAGEAPRRDRGESHAYAHVLRLHPGDDLRREIQRYVEEHEIDAGFVTACAGSLTRATIRMADAPAGTTLTGRVEIVSLSGTAARSGSHLHVAISDGKGNTVGGHLLDGSMVYTTAEVLLLELPEFHMAREKDIETGYFELALHPVWE